MYHITLRFSLLAALFVAANTASLPAQVVKTEKGANIYTGVSPVILDKEGVEISLTNSMVSFWRAYKKYEPQFDATRISNRYRFTRFDQALRVSYGFDKDKRWDLGAEMRFVHLRNDDHARSSPFRVLGSNESGGKTHRGVSLLGMRLRLMPFGELPELTLQATAFYPMGRTPESRQELDAQRTQAGLLATFYQPFNDRTTYFLQADWQSRFRNDENRKTTHSASFGGYLIFSLFGGDSWHLFPGVTYGATLQPSSKGGLYKANHQLLGGLGLLYQPGQQFGIYLNALAPFILESGSVYEEWVRPSFSAVSLGARSMF